jgi:hypothetical protein
MGASQGVEKPVCPVTPRNPPADGRRTLYCAGDTQSEIALRRLTDHLVRRLTDRNHSLEGFFRSLFRPTGQESQVWRNLADGVIQERRNRLG